MKTVICIASIPDGYFGERAKCNLVLKDQKIIAVHSFGSHKLIAIDFSFTSVREALWYLKNHPEYTSRVTVISEVPNENI